MMMWNHFTIVDLCKWFQFQQRRKETDILHFCIRYSIHFCVQLFRFSFLWEIRYCTWKDGKCIASYGELVFRASRKSSSQWPASHWATSEKQQVKWNQCQKHHCAVQNNSNTRVMLRMTFTNSVHCSALCKCIVTAQWTLERRSEIWDRWWSARREGGGPGSNKCGLDAAKEGSAAPIWLQKTKRYLEHRFRCLG